MGSNNRFVFPYRVILSHADGRVETLDPAFLPVPVATDPSVALSIPDMDGEWVIDRLEDEAEFVFTEKAFERDPSLRVATIYARRAAEH
jgi:hypothetical protein